MTSRRHRHPSDAACFLQYGIEKRIRRQVREPIREPEIGGRTNFGVKQVLVESCHLCCSYNRVDHEYSRRVW